MSSRSLALAALHPVARALVAAGISANAVTACSLLLGASAGAMVGAGRFGVGAAMIAVASLGDALDGLVARESGTASVGGALFDASVDRYQELAFLGGLAVFFRDRVGVLAIVLLAIAGSYMVSYGSAKAEALRLAVPGGIMRRTGRAVCLTLGVALAPCAAWLARELLLPSWVETAPIVAAVAIVAVLANASAVLRLRTIAVLASPPSNRAVARTSAAMPSAISGAAEAASASA